MNNFKKISVLLVILWSLSLVMAQERNDGQNIEELPTAPSTPQNSPDRNKQDNDSFSSPDESLLNASTEPSTPQDSPGNKSNAYQWSLSAESLLNVLTAPSTPQNSPDRNKQDSYSLSPLDESLLYLHTEPSSPQDSPGNTKRNNSSWDFTDDEMNHTSASFTHEDTDYSNEQNHKSCSSSNSFHTPIVHNQTRVKPKSSVRKRLFSEDSREKNLETDDSCKKRRLTVSKQKQTNLLTSKKSPNKLAPNKLNTLNSENISSTKSKWLMLNEKAFEGIWHIKVYKGELGNESKDFYIYKLELNQDGESTLEGPYEDTERFRLRPKKQFYTINWKYENKESGGLILEMQNVNDEMNEDKDEEILAFANIKLMPYKNKEKLMIKSETQIGLHSNETLVLEASKIN